jgi:SAM-dependent methyltransferase
VGKVKIPPPFRDFQAQGESPAFGLFHGAAFSTALLPTNSAKEPDFFGISEDIFLGGCFPLDQCPDESHGRYDAIVLSEVLEHLADPAEALGTLRDCLRDDGLMFATMAINIAQEDHVFLSVIRP